MTNVYVFNPFAEGYIGEGKGFAPVRHQALLAEDLSNLPQFLCDPGDIVLLAKRPSEEFLDYLKRAGFQPPEFAELREGRIDPAGSVCRRRIASLRPWAWGPDSVELLEPLFDLLNDAKPANQYFNDGIARLYSKAWSAQLLSNVLAGAGGRDEMSSRLCSEREVGVAVDTVEAALGAIAAIRGRGHHRLVVKQAHGLAGHNAIRLWEPEMLPAQRKWLAHACEVGGQVVVEPWLERELDFSIQLEMGERGLTLCGYTGLVNDLKGQFVANWAEHNYRRCLPAKVAVSLGPGERVPEWLERVYAEIFWRLETELRGVDFVGPVSIDAFVYRTSKGECRLKPIVEINPRYTMGRVLVELMKHAAPGTSGRFRLVSRAQARKEGFGDLPEYGRALTGRLPRLEGLPGGPPGELAAEDGGARGRARIRKGAVCLTDPERVHVCLAVFEVTDPDEIGSES